MDQWQPQGGWARERAEAGEASASQIPQPSQRGMAPPRNAAPANRIRPPMPTALGSRSGQVPVGVAISRPMQAPQWPLAGTIEGGPDPRSNPGYQPPPNRGPAPKRPPRPSQVPQMPESLPEDYRYAQTRYDEDQFSPDVLSPMSQSSRPSTLSSIGSIPDFPAPMQQGPGRRSANLGPPPTSRRGASSYYSQASFVSPIPEESPRPSHQSYASSAAMPASWGSVSPRDYDYDEGEYEDEEIHDYSRYQNGPIAEVRGESRGSNGDDSDDRGLIRSASFGRRAKPSMITTKTSDRIEPPRSIVPPQPQPIQISKLEKMGFGAAPGATLGAPRMNMDQEDPLSSGTGLIDASTSSSDESVPTIAKAITTNEPSPTYTPNPSDPKTNTMLGAYNRASALHPGPSPLRTPSPGFSRLSAIRRPPRLDMDAVRDAEARGSLTSLPDLIKRATKLAAMMDRGKRPGSRNALNDFGNEEFDFGRAKEMGATDGKHKSGLSGMLAAFPPPGVQSPRGGTPNRPPSTWPSGYDPSEPSDQEKGPKKKRRCCGLPVWGFLLLLFLLLVFAAAAVVVPLEFLVFHKNKSSSAPALSAVQQCEQSSTSACKNGGSSILDNGACACICTNGFTGSTCTDANATGCSTTSISGVTGNVTLGDAIVRLISGGQTNYSIPLDAKTIIARFNTNSLSCATENALVTFDGNSGRVGNANDVVKATAPSATAAAKLRNRQDARSTTSSSSSAPVATGSGGIVFDPSNPSPTTAAVVPTSTPMSSAANPSGTFAITEEVLDFARVVVLYILQQTTLDEAASAQNTLQHFFSLESFTNKAAMNVSLGNGAFTDLVGFSVNVGNGSIGAKNASVTRRMVGTGMRKRSVRLWETPW